MAWLTRTDGLWHGLRRRWLLIASGALLFLLLLSAQLLPQLPGQLSGDPTAAARWLLGASAEYGAAGGLLRGLGLFNVLHSFLLQLLFALLTLILSVYLGDWLAVALSYRQLPTVLTQNEREPGAPLPLPAVQKIYRWRQLAASPVDETVARLQTDLAAHYDQIINVVAPERFDAAAEGTQPEQRFLATRALPWSMVRLALMVGLLLAVFVVWRIVITGWEVTTPVLAPGAEYRSASHGITIAYGAPQGQGEATPQVQVQVGDEEATLSAGVRVADTVGGVDVTAQPTLPGLYIATTDGKPALARAGQSETVAGLGLTFPGPGSEESLILPAAAIGLRIVRLGDKAAAQSGAGYLLEVYPGGESQPAKRLEIGAEPLETVAINDDELTLRFVHLPGLTVAARYLPGVWGLWVAFALIVLGGVGSWFRPTFALVQVAPWPNERTVVTLQSDEAATITRLTARLEAEMTPK